MIADKISYKKSADKTFCELILDGVRYKMCSFG